ncbi:hypothetical protein D7X74_14735 [Corallococcus sp. CA047B]|uniref:Ig-like domain-containing protein n=1 Tax=Corallococcus sp. CA047B TaxID=2316729 RepID=UPI000EA392C4|nr:Ig-like domain-containing protein [Corallococcus sp. CA047B]RKH16693.1 hypothetical protein D7X74_14735 [Corallococcus sp. CA047B]
MSPLQKIARWLGGTVALLSSTACLSIPPLEASNTQVRFVTPESPAYTNGIVSVQLDVTGDDPSRVELLLDGALLTIVEPPYDYSWDTTSTPEGPHQLVVRASTGGAVFTSGPREVVVDRTPPQVVMRTPKPSAQTVWVRSLIQAVFNEPLQTSTLTNESVRLKMGGIDISKTVSPSSDGTTVTVSPVTAFKAAASAALILTSDITDLAGNRLAAQSEDWSWEMPSWIPWGQAEGAVVTTGAAQLGSYDFDSKGRLVAAWHILEGSARRLYVRRWEDGEWHQFGEALGGTGADARIEEAALTLTRDDIPIVAWSEVDLAGIFQLHAQQWTGSQWTPLSDPASPSEVLTHKQSPSFFRTSGGKPALIWREWKNNSASLCISTLDEQHWTWQRTIKCIATPTPDVHTNSQAVLQFSTADAPVVAWATPGPPITLHISHFVDQDWIELESDFTTDVQGGLLGMSLDGTQKPLISWRQFDGNAESLYVSRWTGTYWEELGGRLDAVTGKTSVFAHSIAGDATGTPMVAWIEQGAPPGKLYIRRWEGGVWSPIDVQSLGQDFVSFHGFRRTASDRLLLTWVDGSVDGTGPLRVRQFNQ